jgi:hypothetical protein
VCPEGLQCLLPQGMHVELFVEGYCCRDLAVNEAEDTSTASAAVAGAAGYTKYEIFFCVTLLALMKVAIHVQHNTGTSYEDRCEMSTALSLNKCEQTLEGSIAREK